MEALNAYCKVKIRTLDINKTMFIVNNNWYELLSNVIGNKLSSNTWLRASDEVTNGLPGVFKLVDDLLIGGQSGH